MNKDTIPNPIATPGVIPLEIATVAAVTASDVGIPMTTNIQPMVAAVVKRRPSMIRLP